VRIQAIEIKSHEGKGLSMPVSTIDQKASSVDPYRRLSASQVIAYRNCPRYWYYGWERRLKTPLPPQIIRGNAAEACICRVMRDSPSLHLAEDEDAMSTPLNKDGAPEWDDPSNWPGPRIEPVEKPLRPSDMDSLRIWAHARARVHFQRCWDEACDDWAANPNRKGTVEDADPDQCLSMVLRGIDLHLQEVEECLNSEDVDVDAWRSGKSRPVWPAPDGFPRDWSSPSHAAYDIGSDMHVVEAWEIARPWFVDPDAASFTQTSTHPGGWFQGEYDLVYRWDGATRIIDIKASVGRGDRSHGYLDQLRMYGWLWWATHERKETVTGLAIWYLGAGDPKDVVMPAVEEMESMDRDLFELYSKIRESNPSIEECPAEPAPLRRFKDGGVPDGEPVESDIRARCNRCEYAGFCEGSNQEPNLIQMETIQRFGHTWDITPLQAIRTRFSAIGDVSRLTGPDLNEDETVDVRFTMVDGWDRATVRPHRMGGPKRVTRSIKEGSRVRVDNAMPSLWKGQLNLDLDSLSSISPAEEGDEASIVDIETRVSVVGRVWSIDAYPDGASVSRWAITLVDASGSASAVAFKQFIPTAAASISRGDVIGVLNGEVGEWAGRPQIKMGPGTRVVVIDDEA
tara:strand:- start:2010 stop:3887 length:1878 start_codon:yes stop_codon:yes gene_type:complete